MNLDDRICYCCHVPLRKLVNFARRTRPVRASQMSECLGAGTGCGWCIPILQRIFEQCRDAAGNPAEIQACLPVSAEEYAAGRQKYLQQRESRHGF